MKKADFSLYSRSSVMNFEFKRLKALSKPPCFHLHVDAKWLSQELEHLLLSRFGFTVDNFSENRDGILSYAPARHITRKFDDVREFNSTYRQVLALAQTPNWFSGYLEGEYVSFDIPLPTAKLADQLPEPPFHIEHASLLSGTFRESEIHITLDRDASDPTVRKILLKIGFVLATIPKSYGVAEIFTVQGTRKQIRELLSLTLKYLNSIGGISRGSIKEEIIARWWISPDISSLPPVIGKCF
jgi:hypothetical protein